MSAVMPECGHVFHLMEVDHLEDNPQVHLHFLTGDDEYAMIGYMRVELCCHGCGESVLVYYNDPKRGDTRHMKLRDGFEYRHRYCQNRGYDQNCPNYRSAFHTVDLRPLKRKRSASRPEERRTAGVSPRTRQSGRRPRRSGFRKETAPGR